MGNPSLVIPNGSRSYSPYQHTCFGHLQKKLGIAPRGSVDIVFGLGKISRIRWLIAGAAFVLLGIVGLFLPILQGILFIVIGLLCLSKGSALVRSKKMGFKQRFPRLGSKLTFLEDKARAWRQRRKEKKNQ